MNGVLKDEATYFGNSEKYTGDSGSSTNMWVIEDVYDFIEIVKTMGGYARMVNDINFNDHSTYKMGISNVTLGSTYMRATHIYGDGHKIYNMICSGTVDIWIYHIENCDFVNMGLLNTPHFPIRLKGNPGNGTVYEDGDMKHCDFGIFASNANMNWVGSLSECTFNITGSIGGTQGSGEYKDGYGRYLISFPNNFTANMCWFNFKNVTGNYQTLFTQNNSHAGSNGTHIRNSWFTGKIKNSNTSTADMLSYYDFGSSHYGPLNVESSYFAFEYNGKAIQNRAGSATCFIDKEVLTKSGATFTNNSSVKLVPTTAQAMDSEYLGSIGFTTIPVLSEEDAGSDS